MGGGDETAGGTAEPAAGRLGAGKVGALKRAGATGEIGPGADTGAAVGAMAAERAAGLGAKPPDGGGAMVAALAGPGAIATLGVGPAAGPVAGVASP